MSQASRQVFWVTELVCLWLVMADSISSCFQPQFLLGGVHYHHRAGSQLGSVSALWEPFSAMSVSFIH